MSTRSAKRAASAEEHKLSHVEALLLAQGAWEMGSGPPTWPAIAKILSKHVLVTRPKSFFTAQSCHAMYDKIMQEAGLEADEASSLPRSETNRRLAEKYFKLRHDELIQLILAEENAFKTILKEIEDIKAGKWDAQIKTNPDAQVSASEDKSSSQPPVAETMGDEAFSGSDLSRVTESSSPHSQARDDSETPLAKSADIHQAESQESPSQVAIDESEEQKTPTASVETEPMDVEIGEGVSTQETVVDSSAAEQSVDTIMSDAVNAEPNEHDTEEPRREEEEEEEDVAPSKPEEEETDQDENEVEETTATKDAPEEEATKSTEHQPEEEEEEEEAREATEEPEEAEAEVAQALEDGLRTSPGADDDHEEQEGVEEPEHPVEGTASDEGPTQVTRRSTRNRPAAPTVPATRKTRGRRRVSEPDVQSEGENVDVDDTKVETQDEDMPSSPVPIGTRRRKRKSSTAEAVESPRDRKRQRDESEPLEDDEAGPSTGGRRRRGDRSEEQVALKKFQNVIGMLHSQISQHRNGNIFHNPIRTVEAPDYHDIVKRPMDLKTIKTRVKDGLIANSLEYQRDIFLMFANAMMYNRPGSDVYHMAEDMMHESEGYIQAFRQTEGLVRNRP